MERNIEYESISGKWIKQLSALFAAITAKGEDSSFHPHPLTEEEAERIAKRRGKDLYFLQIVASKVTGYGILRGWDEGYEVPSLAITIHPDSRRQGLGKHFMLFLHDQARSRGSERIRLKVYPENIGALNLYANLGYDFSAKVGEQLVGFLEL